MKNLISNPLHKVIIYLWCSIALLMASSLGLKAEETINIIIKTNLGNIEAELYSERAPITVTNFVENIKAGLYEDGQFYRAVRGKNPLRSSKKNLTLIQGGMDESKQTRPPIANETTKTSGLSHVNATLSMARGDPGTADAEFFICIGDNSILDYAEMGEDGNEVPGYAAFGKVTKGMDIVQLIQASPTGHRTLSEKEKAWAPDWILAELLNESIVISNIEIIK